MRPRLWYFALYEDIGVSHRVVLISHGITCVSPFNDNVAAYGHIVYTSASH